jgi:di/tricarboxylate transporter
MPALPEPAAIAALLVTGIALVMFTRERIPLEASALLVLLVVGLGAHLYPMSRGNENFDLTVVLNGFGNQALIAIVCLMLCAKGLEQSGALHGVARVLAKIWGKQPQLAFLVTIVVAAVLSMFMNNTPIVAMLLPLLVSVALRTGIDGSRILMPVGYATIIGGMATTIGTSTNLLVVGIATDMGLRPFGMFDFTLPAAAAAAVAIPFLWLVAPRMLPKRTAPMGDTSPRIFDATLHVTESSRVNGKTLAEARELTGDAIKVLNVERGQGLFVARLPTLTLREGDRLHVRDTRDRLKEFEQALGAGLYTAADDTSLEDTATFVAPNQQLAEVVVTASSPLNGRLLSEMHLLARYGLVAVALHRPKTSAKPARLEGARLQAADVILVQGPKDSIQKLKNTGYLMVLDGSLDLPTAHRAKRTLAIMFAVVAAAALGWLPIAVAAALGAGAMLLTGCLRWGRAAEALDVRIILLIVAALALGKSLSVSGAASYLAEVFLYTTGTLSIALKISLLMLSMALLTEIVTNNAAAAIGTPIAFAIALAEGVNPEPFVLAVLFGGNMSFMTPMGYQTNLLVMSAGGYRFSDFVRVGLPLQLLVWLALSWALAAIYGL